VRCGDKVVVETDPASLPDAFDDLDVDAGFDLPTCEKTVAGPSLGVEYAQKLFDYAGTAKLADGRDVPFNASSAVEASLCFAPRFKLKADVGFLKVRSFEVSATGELQARLFLTVATTLPPSVDDKMRAELAGKPLTKSQSAILVDRDIPLASLGLGGVKLPITAHTSATLACDFTFTAPVEVKTGATATASLTAGLSYADGKLSPIFDKTASFVPTPPTFTKDGLLHAVCTVTPKIELKIFGLATSELTTRARVGLGAQQTCGGKDAQGATQKSTSGDVEARLSAAVLAKLDLFGVKKWKKECTLFDVNATARYDRTFAVASGGVGAAACTPLGPFPVPAPPAANPAACFGETQESGAASPIIPGTCTHDVCTAGEKLGQACDSCTMQVCAVDPYCCDTYWGASCFDRVAKICGKTCAP
jgi:hypothetical protein